ncbi:transcriptional regulator [Scytonema hofmannii PCC 7110]|uniref:Protein argonaute n=1 Tax=Scytonema hofmannii PCC 7110 TaxID=128403 RepID=A0A139WY18_9CYAN|nr:RNA-binding domain-containing protein [Scytonema hofmannii]KYC37326.1 transcriptional regulator [Scytonema hofmannii PCC 7110]
MPTPREVFENPEWYWSLLTLDSDVKFEDQYFDRKEVGQPEQHGGVSKSQVNALVEQVRECVSAFANANKAGGLLVIGISTKGQARGIDNLTEDQRNRVTNINDMLVNQYAEVKLCDYQETSGYPCKICLIYVPYTKDGICETPGYSPKSWMRKGVQNVPLSDQQRESLRRDKRIIDYEQTYCCSYKPEDVDRGTLDVFRQVYLDEATYEFSDEELLYHAGALDKDSSGNYFFTKVGFLFFASNPQRVLPSSYIRLLRFETNVNEERGLPTFERNFSGSITKQIRDIRTFFQESGFFKAYSKRNPQGGGFIEEPEYPHIAVDEAIVNAVAHRDYAMSIPIECEYYKDAFVVCNSGRIIQRDKDVPAHFSLDDTVLISTPRNPKLIEWLKLMRDQRGIAFVRALSEGTKRMYKEMQALNLPSPDYRVSDAQTKVTLFSRAAEREALLQADSTLQVTEYANLFPLYITIENGKEVDAEYLKQRQGDITSSLKDALVAHGWYIDSSKFGKIIAHRKQSNFQLSKEVCQIVRLYPAYSFQLRHYWGKSYLCIDYTLEVKNICSIEKLLTLFQPNELVSRTAVAQWNGKGWYLGKITSVNHEWSNVYLFDFDKEEQVASSKVIPNLSRELIEQVLRKRKIRFELPQAIKKYSLALEPNAARTRAERTRATAEDIAKTIFPLLTNQMTVLLQPTPVPLFRQGTIGSKLLVRSLSEPTVEFNHGRSSADIRDGITRFGAFGNSPKIIEIVPICTSELRTNMVNLIERLKTGKYKYRGSEKTFSTRFTYSSIVTIPSSDLALDECRRLLKENPNWISNKHLNRIFLVHTPEQGYASDDEVSPYYRIKRLLFENGIPCQMVDTPILHNPDWKDLNLSLNIIAKCGVTPWVLPDALPDADFFIGLSYTQSRRQGSERLMGYANVFSEYGRWEFYSGNTETFAYNERTQYFQTLIEQTLERLNLQETPHIYFHYSAKFSREDRAAILSAARKIKPQGVYSFVWINTHHNVRLYDSRVETDGSLSRGSYVIASPNQIYLSTTGHNPYRKVLGTPQTLEINIWTYHPENAPKSLPDLKALAVQILSLTKLNWASTDSLCAVPITTKYASNIAYLTDAFLRQGSTFQLNKVLEETPWFL